MLKRILLLLDETQSAGIARHYAFQLAREMNAEIVGLAGVDLSYIEAPMLGGLGTAAYKARLEEALTAQAKATRRRLHEAFARDCERHRIGLNWLSFDGDPLESLYLATENSDLLVAGHDIAFHGAVHELSSEVLAKLLRVSPRPIVVCGNAPPPGRDIMIAYDGSVPVMRALQLFVSAGHGPRSVHSRHLDRRGRGACCPPNGRRD